MATWVAKSPSPFARGRLGHIVDNGKFYTIGGNDATGAVQAIVTEYDPVTDTHRQMANLPQALRFTRGAGLGGKIHIIGGYTGSAYVNTHYELNVNTNTYATKAVYPHTVAQGSAFADNGLIFYMSGWSGTAGAVTANCHKYDPVTNQWTLLAPHPNPRELTTFAYDGRQGQWYFYIFGGSPNINVVYRYDPVNDVWTQRANAPASFQVGIAGLINGGKMLVTATLQGSAGVTDTYLFDIAGNSWSTGEPYPIALMSSGGGSIQDADGNWVMYVIEGRNGASYYNDVYMHQEAAPTGVPQALEGSISGQSGQSATLRKTISMGGSSPSVSGVNGSLKLFKEISSSLASVSTVNGDITINRGLNGNSDSVSSVTSDIFGLSFNVAGNVAGFSDVQSVIGAERGIEGIVSSQSIVSGEMAVFRDMNGQVNSSSMISDVPLLRYRTLEANVIEGKSQIPSALLLKTISMDGTIQADSINSGIIEKEMSLQGVVFGDSSVTGGLNRSMFIDGLVTAASHVENMNLPIYREVSGTVSGTSSITATFFVVGEVSLVGRIDNQSSLSSSMTALKPLQGDIISESVASVQSIELFRSMSGEIAGGSSADGVIQRFMSMQGSLDEFSSLDGWLARAIGVDGSIQSSTDLNGHINRMIEMESTVQISSSMDGMIIRAISLDSDVQAFSSLADADLLRWRELDGSLSSQSMIDAKMNRLRPFMGSIQAVTSLFAEFNVEGEIWLDGNILALSSLTGASGVAREISGFIESYSDIHPSYLMREIPINGDIANVSGSQAFLSRIYQIEGDTGAFSGLDGLINKIRAISGQISSYNRLDGGLRMFWEMDGRIDGRVDLQAESIVFYDLGGGLMANSSMSGQMMILLDLTTETIAAVSSLMLSKMENVSPPKIDIIRLNGKMQIRIILQAEHDIFSSLIGEHESLARLKAEHESKKDLKGEHETVIRLDGDLSG